MLIPFARVVRCTISFRDPQGEKGTTHELAAHVDIEVVNALLLVRLIRTLYHVLR